MKPIDLLTDTHPLLSDRVRLAIMAAVASAGEPVDFNTLLSSLELTKGNLSTHVRKLEEAGLIEVTKAFVGRKPRTTYEVTREGRVAVKKYLEQVEALLKGALEGE